MGKKSNRLFKAHREDLLGLIEAGYYGYLPEPELRHNINPIDIEVILCPLCMKLFTIDQMTAEHAPPKKLGGKVRVLTCKSCNNDHGSELDSKLVSYIEERDTILGINPKYIRAKIRPQNSNDPANAQVLFSTDRKIRMEVLNASRKESIENLIKRLHSGNAEIIVNFELTAIHFAALSLIRTAYIIGFQHLGYSFLGNLGFSLVRYQLNHPLEPVFPTESVQMDVEVPGELLGVNIVTKPTAMISYFIIFDVQILNGRRRRVGVLLPGPSPDHYLMFENLKQFDGTKFDISHVNEINWKLVTGQ